MSTLDKVTATVSDAAAAVSNAVGDAANAAGEALVSQHNPHESACRIRHCIHAVPTHYDGEKGVKQPEI